jgi:hypothetical protein
MDSIELVEKALSCDLGDNRVPRHLWTLPWARIHHGERLQQIQTEYPDDIVHCPLFYIEEPMVAGDPYNGKPYTDEWGATFTSIHPGIVGEVKEPFISDWEDLFELRLPREKLTVDRDKVDAYCKSTDKYVITDCLARPFERYQFMRTSEQTYYDLAEQSEGFFELLNRIHDFFVQEIEVWAKTAVQGLWIMDDWGAQTSLLISPDQWRRIFKPLYSEYVDIAHSNGKKLFMHSDGYILDIIPDLIEIGVDALNSQIFCMGLDNLHKFRGKITFWGEIDRQHILADDPPEKVRDAVVQVKENIYYNGGVIAQCEFGPGAKPDNVETVFRTWNEIQP